MKLETKYQPHDEVWFMHQDRPFEGKIYQVTAKATANMFGKPPDWREQTTYSVELPDQHTTVRVEVPEEKLFRDKLSLIASL